MYDIGPRLVINGHAKKKLSKLVLKQTFSMQRQLESGWDTKKTNRISFQTIAIVFIDQEVPRRNYQGFRDSSMEDTIIFP